MASVTLGNFQKVVLIIVAFLFMIPIMVPLADFLIGTFTLPGILIATGFLLMIFAPKKMVVIRGTNVAKPKKKITYLLFGFIVFILGALELLEYFNMPLISMPTDTIHFILAGVGVGLILLSIGLDRTIKVKFPQQEYVPAPAAAAA